MKIFVKESDYDKIKSQISDVEFEKKTMVDAMKKVCEDLQKEKETIFLNIGSEAYKNFVINVDECDFSDLFSKIKEIDNEISSKELKTQDLICRYDNELEFLSSKLNTVPENQEKQFEDFVTKNQEVQTPVFVEPVDEEEVLNNTTKTEPVVVNSTPSVRFCEKCGSKLVAGYKFCQSCGTKLTL